MNKKYIAYRTETLKELNGQSFRALHIALSLYRAMRGRKITRKLNQSDIYQTTIDLGIETLPKDPHDGMLIGRLNIFPDYRASCYLTDILSAEETPHE